MKEKDLSLKLRHGMVFGLSEQVSKTLRASCTCSHELQLMKSRQVRDQLLSSSVVLFQSLSRAPLQTYTSKH